MPCLPKKPSWDHRWYYQITNVPRNSQIPWWYQNSLDSTAFRWSVVQHQRPDHPGCKEELADWKCPSEVDEVWDNYNMGLITNNERYNQIIDIWSRVIQSHRNTDSWTGIKTGLQLCLHDARFRPRVLNNRSSAGRFEGLMAKPRKSGFIGSWDH